MRKESRWRKAKNLFALGTVLLLSVGFLACQQTSPEDEQEAALADEWEWLKTRKAELEEVRAELAAVREQMAEAPEEVPEDLAEGEEAPPTRDELAAKAEELKDKARGLADEFGQRLIQFINDQQISVDAERTEVQREALRMKSDEDIVLAQEYIDLGGEYGRAIDIYDQALIWDPDYDRLHAAKAHAEEMRYITEDRFAQVKNQMTQDEVRALLGTPKRTNIRDFDNGVVGWFYPKEEPRAAAGVYFRERKGELLVYETDFDAIKTDDEG